MSFLCIFVLCKCFFNPRCERESLVSFLTVPESEECPMEKISNSEVWFGRSEIPLQYEYITSPKI
jgi:hypothetical protein